MTNRNGYFGDRVCTELFKTVCVFDCDAKEITEKTCPGTTDTFADFIQLHGSLYKWQSQSTTYDDARATCQQEGGVLAEFKTAQEFMGVLQFSGIVMLGSQACSLQVLQLYFDISEVQGGRFFTGLRADPAQSGDTVKSKCSGDLATCASVLRWDSDDSSFDASSPWLKPDFFTANSQLCIVIDPVNDLF